MTNSEIESYATAFRMAYGVNATKDFTIEKALFLSTIKANEIAELLEVDIWDVPKIINFFMRPDKPSRTGQQIVGSLAAELYELRDFELSPHYFFFMFCGKTAYYSQALIEFGKLTQTGILAPLTLEAQPYAIFKGKNQSRCEFICTDAKQDIHIASFPIAAAPLVAEEYLHGSCPQLSSEGIMVGSTLLRKSVGPCLVPDHLYAYAVQ